VKDRGSYRKGLGYGALSSLTMIALGFVSSVVIARVYGIDEIGRYALALAPSLVLLYLSTAQEQAALVRALSVLAPRDPRATGLFAAVMAFSAGLTVVVAAVTVPVTALIFHGPIDHPELFGPACALVTSHTLIANTGWNLDMVLSAYRAGRELFWVRLNQALAFVVLAVALGLAWDSVWALVLATSGSGAIALVHRMLAVRVYMRLSVPRNQLRAGLRELPSMVRFGLRLAPTGVAHGLTAQVGIWVLGAASSIATVGAYQRAWQLGNRFLETNSRMTEMLFPTLVERRAGGDRHGFDRALIDTMRYAAAALLLLAAVGGGAAFGVMELFGPGFDSAGNALAILLLVPALAAAASAHGQALIADDQPLTTTAVALGQLLLTVALTLALVPPLGMSGAALAWTGAYLPTVAVLATLTRRHLSRPLRELWPARQLAVLALAFAAGFAAARYVDGAVDSIVGLPFALAAGSLAYGVAFTICGGVTPRDRRRLAELATRLPPVLRRRVAAR
jgi:O-antigen/teichoic acid export membrane protein